MSRTRVHVRAEHEWQNFGVMQDYDTDTWLMPLSPNGLFKRVRTGFLITTGQPYGIFDITVETHPARPPVQVDGWEEVAEFSVTLGSEPHALAGRYWDHPDLQQVNFAGAGNYRVRVHARGRWAHRKPFTEDDLHVLIEEFFLLQLWVEPPGRDEFILDDPRRLSDPQG